jgi:hypothetical protein
MFLLLRDHHIYTSRLLVADIMIYADALVTIRVWLAKRNALLCTPFMKKKHKTYQPFQMVSAIFMILALLWLTVSTPFVYTHQQKQASQKGNLTLSSSIADTNEEEDTNPYGNNTEEKNPYSGNSVSEEYLHHHHTDEHFLLTNSQFHKFENAEAYIAYHGELDVPPPDAA